MNINDFKKIINIRDTSKTTKETGYTYEISLQELINKYLNLEVRDYYMILKWIRKKYFIVCQNCNRYKALHIHHIDKDRSNNRLTNLIMVCKECHYQIHNEDRRKIKFYNHQFYFINPIKEDSIEINTGFYNIKKKEINKHERINYIERGFCIKCEKIAFIRHDTELCNDCNVINEV